MEEKRVDQNESASLPAAAASLAAGREGQQDWKTLNFSDSSQRAEHIAAFMAWLPPVLRCAPEIDWEALPSRVMGTLLRTTAQTVDALPITLAVALARAGLDDGSLLTACRGLTRLLRRMRQECCLTTLQDLRQVATWDSFVQRVSCPARDGHSGPPAPPSGMVGIMSTYQAVVNTYVRRYLEETLTDARRLAWQRALDALGLDPPPTWHDVILPPLPYKYIERTGLRARDRLRAKQRRKDHTEVLTPLHPVLVQIALLRKQAVERLVAAYRAERERATTLPHHFTHRARIPELNQDARTLAAVELTFREVDLHFTLWDRSAWIQEHPGRASSRHSRIDLKRRRRAYAARRDTVFVQCHNLPEDLFWFGRIIAGRVLGRVRRKGISPKRLTAAAELGEPAGFHTTHAGLLRYDISMGRWIASNVSFSEVVFDPEVLYRGVLYAAALAVVALTCGARASELLQISDRRWEVIAVDEMREGRPTGQQTHIVVQRLLPKGSKTEDGRQFYLMSEQALPLLREITEGLEAAHGGRVPVVQPLNSSKEAHLEPEPYLFQWRARADGRLGLLDPGDIPSLLRFLFHGLSFTTRRSGEPIRIATHLCRHICAEAARTEYHVPLEAIAYLLHHRTNGMSETGRMPFSIPEATHYYAALPERQQLGLLHALQVEMGQRSTADVAPLRPPTASELAEMDDWLRAVFEEWGMIGPVALGFCSAGMCVRPGARALCIGCPYLVVDHRRLGTARTWRRFYVRDIALLEEQGLVGDVRQKRQALEHLDGHIRVMQLQIQVLKDGGHLPPFLSLPHPDDLVEAVEAVEANASEADASQTGETGEMGTGPGDGAAGDQVTGEGGVA